MNKQANFSAISSSEVLVLNEKFISRQRVEAYRAYGIDLVQGMHSFENAVSGLLIPYKTNLH